MYYIFFIFLGISCNESICFHLPASGKWELADLRQVSEIVRSAKHIHFKSISKAQIRVTIVEKGGSYGCIIN